MSIHAFDSYHSIAYHSIACLKILTDTNLWIYFWEWILYVWNEIWQFWCSLWLNETWIEFTKTNQSQLQQSILISNSDTSCNLCLHWYFSHQVSSPHFFCFYFRYIINKFTNTLRKVNLSQLESQMQILLSSWQIHFPFRNFCFLEFWEHFISNNLNLAFCAKMERNLQ